MIFLCVVEFHVLLNLFGYIYRLAISALSFFTWLSRRLVLRYCPRLLCTVLPSIFARLALLDTSSLPVPETTFNPTEREML